MLVCSGFRTPGADWGGRCGAVGGDAEGKVFADGGDEAGVEGFPHARGFRADGVADVVSSCIG